MKLTPKEVYDKLVSEDKILEAEGRITFVFSDVSIVVRQRDVVGNILQEWLQGWLTKHGVEFAVNDNTQMPPDFFLDTTNRQHSLLEVKAFNHSAGPAFDIADFRMYEEEVQKKPWMLDVDYLIFGYDMSPEGIVTVKEVWLKKVWEITSASGDWPMKLQVKKGVVHKIRPCTWYAATTRFPVFDSMEDFLAALEETIYQNSQTRNLAATWKKGLVDNYKAHYKQSLTIPRWYEIADKYQGKHHN